MVLGKRIRHNRCICMLCIIFLIAVSMTGCVKEYAADDIKAYAKDTLSLRSVSVEKTPQKYKDEEGYTDVVWTVHDKTNDVTFHVCDDTFWGVESVSNMLLNDYEASVFAAYADKLPTDILSYEITEYDHLTYAKIAADYSNETELAACLSELKEIYAFYAAKGFPHLDIRYELNDVSNGNRDASETDAGKKAYTGTLYEFSSGSE